ncbi:MAG: type IV toxin-antitoxin system AbiEi family antitoxin domain-containing protein [Mycobacteriales bacterium]
MVVPPEASRQRGVFSLQQARAAGVGQRALRRALADGTVVQVRPCVFAAWDLSSGRDVVAVHRARVLAEQLGRGPGWFAARRSAALLMGLPLIGRPPLRPQLLRDAAGTRGRGTDRHARVGALPPGQRTVVDGVPVTSPARTVIDIARGESFRNAVVVADAALRRGVTRGDLEQVLAGMRRWPGAARARRAVAFADGRAESPGESVTRVACLLEGLPVPEPQVEVWRDGRFVARVDLLVEEGLLLIESDGAVKFTDPGVLPALLARHEELRDCGLEVLRTDWDQTFSRTQLFGDRVRDRLRTSYARRLAPGVELRRTVTRPVGPSLATPRSPAA